MAEGSINDNIIQGMTGFIKIYIILVYYVSQDNFNIMGCGDTDQRYLDIYYNTWYIFRLIKVFNFSGYIKPLTFNYLPDNSEWNQIS